MRSEKGSLPREDNNYCWRYLRFLFRSYAQECRLRLWCEWRDWNPNMSPYVLEERMMASDDFRDIASRIESADGYFLPEGF